jgi:hypothetical protein
MRGKDKQFLIHKCYSSCYPSLNIVNSYIFVYLINGQFSYVLWRIIISLQKLELA